MGQTLSLIEDGAARFLSFVVEEREGEGTYSCSCSESEEFTQAHRASISLLLSPFRQAREEGSEKKKGETGKDKEKGKSLQLFLFLFCSFYCLSQSNPSFFFLWHYFFARA